MLSVPANAQTAPPESGSPTPTGSSVGTNTADSVPIENGVLEDTKSDQQNNTPPSELVADERVTSEDLGAVEARILPGHPLYGLKRFWWGVQEGVTFNPVDDATLKFKHANQQLAEIQQLITQDGIAAVDFQVLNRAIAHFKGKLTAVSQNTAQLKNAEAKGVDTFLDEVVKKQIKQQRLLDSIVKEAVAVKKESSIPSEDGPSLDSQKAEALLALANETKKDAAEQFTKVLVDVGEEPEKTGERLTNAFGEDTGSEFRSLKHLELLESLEKNAPDSIQVAITIAKKNTEEVFKERIKELPPAVRADRFKNYVRHTTADETKLFRMLEDIKAAVPIDMLETIEEIKEIVVDNFETKVSLMDTDRVKESLWSDFASDDFSDILAIEDFRSRMEKTSEERAKIDALSDASLAAFKKKFTDAQSQEQADIFQQLSKDTLTNPSLKTFRLIQELEEAARANPEKRAFLDDIGKQVQENLEQAFRRDPRRSVSELASLNPEDMAVLKVIAFDPAFQKELVKKQTQTFEAFATQIENPNEFDHFYDRFSGLPQEVVNDIKTSNPNFQTNMWAKQRKMEERRIQEERERQIAFATLDYKEREFYHQASRLERQREDEFWNAYNQIPWDDFDARKAMWENKIAESIKQQEEVFAERKQLFEDRLRVDPFGCDEVCQKIQVLSLEQEYRHQKERLSDDIIRERNKVTTESDQFKRNNPLFGKCNTNDPQSCELYCRDHRGEPGCDVFTFKQQCPPTQYFDYTLQRCAPSTSITAQNCAQGFYFDPGQQSCAPDPYYRPACGYGRYWDEAARACRTETKACTATHDANGAAYWQGDCYNNKDCGPGLYWNDKKRECMPTDATECDQGYYYDYGLRRCERDHERDCRSDEYFDYTKQSCAPMNKISCPAFDILPCPQGQHHEGYTDEKGCWLPGQCVPDKKQCSPTPFPCPSGSARKTFDVNGCVEYTECAPILCPQVLPRVCTQNEKPIPPNPNDPCSQPSCVFVPDVSCKKYTPDACQTGYYREWSTDERGCSVPGVCVSTKKVAVCGNTLCEENETTTSCPADCHTKENNWVSRTWSFGDGSTQQSYILSRVDTDYAKYIADTDLRCRATERFRGWLPGAGDAANWRNFGIPDCPSQMTTTTPAVICANGEWYNTTTSACERPITCPNNGFNTGNGSSSCNITSCPNGCRYDSTGCPSLCLAPTSSCGDGACGSGETAISCPADCGGTYKGDERSCPGFAYSMWDSTGVRYCRLNTEAKCNYTYPSYLNNDGSYTAEKCPVDSTPQTRTMEQTCSMMSGWHYNATTNSCVRDGVTCSNPTSCSACPSGTGSGSSGSQSQWCTWDNNGCPTGCQTSTWNSGAGCGSYMSQTSCEAVTNCRWSQSSSGSSQGYCYYSSNSTWTSTCNSNGRCEAGEDRGNCSSDCGSSGVYCGNRVCESGESTISCPSDCTSGAAVQCSNNGFNTGNGAATCNNSACPNGCNWSNGCPTGCWSSSGYCGDRSCNNGETATSCSTDCGSSAGYCGDGACASNESSASCPSDCGGTGTSVSCGTATCTGGSYCANSNQSICCQSSQMFCSSSNSCVNSMSECAAQCPNNGYNTGNGSMACNYSTCQSGCTWNSSGCPTGCSQTQSQGTPCGSATCGFGYYCANSGNGICCANAEFYCTSSNSCVTSNAVCAAGSISLAPETGRMPAASPLELYTTIVGSILALSWTIRFLV